MRCCILCLAFLPLLIHAQQSRALLNRLPYIQERRPDSPPPLLNPASALEILEPLPQLDLPRQLPPEFISDPDQRQLMEWFAEASAQLSEGNADKAIELLEQEVQLRPDDVNIRVSYADSLYAAERYREAQQQYEMVLRDAPFHFQSLNNLGWLLATVSDPGMKDPETALELAGRARLIRPNSHHMWSTLSQATYELGRYSEAEAAIANALRLAQQTGVNARVLAGYVIHRDRCILAREATSLLE